MLSTLCAALWQQRHSEASNLRSFLRSRDSSLVSALNEILSCHGALQGAVRRGEKTAVRACENMDSTLFAAVKEVNTKMVAASARERELDEAALQTIASLLRGWVQQQTAEVEEKANNARTAAIRDLSTSHERERRCLMEVMEAKRVALLEALSERQDAEVKATEGRLRWEYERETGHSAQDSNGSLRDMLELELGHLRASQAETTRATSEQLAELVEARFQALLHRQTKEKEKEELQVDEHKHCLLFEIFAATQATRALSEQAFQHHIQRMLAEESVDPEYSKSVGSFGRVLRKNLAGDARVSNAETESGFDRSRHLIQKKVRELIETAEAKLTVKDEREFSAMKDKYKAGLNKCLSAGDAGLNRVISSLERAEDAEVEAERRLELFIRDQLILGERAKLDRGVDEDMRRFERALTRAESHEREADETLRAVWRDQLTMERKRLVDAAERNLESRRRVLEAVVAEHEKQREKQRRRQKRREAEKRRLTEMYLIRRMTFITTELWTCLKTAKQLEAQGASLTENSFPRLRIGSSLKERVAALKVWHGEGNALDEELSQRMHGWKQQAERRRQTRETSLTVLLASEVEHEQEKAKAEGEEETFAVEMQDKSVPFPLRTPEELGFTKEPTDLEIESQRLQEKLKAAVQSALDDKEHLIGEIQRQLQEVQVRLYEEMKVRQEAWTQTLQRRERLYEEDGLEAVRARHLEELTAFEQMRGEEMAFALCQAKADYMHRHPRDEAASEEEQRRYWEGLQAELSNVRQELKEKHEFTLTKLKEKHASELGHGPEELSTSPQREDGIAEMRETTQRLEREAAAEDEERRRRRQEVAGETQRRFQATLEKKEKEFAAEMKRKEDALQSDLAEQEETLRCRAEERDTQRKRVAEEKARRLKQSLLMGKLSPRELESVEQTLRKFHEEKAALENALDEEEKRQGAALVARVSRKKLERRRKDRERRDAEKKRFFAKQEEISQILRERERQKELAAVRAKQAAKEREEELKRREQRAKELQEEQQWLPLVRQLAAEEQAAGLFDSLDESGRPTEWKSSVMKSIVEANATLRRTEPFVKIFLSQLRASERLMSLLSKPGKEASRVTKKLDAIEVQKNAEEDDSSSGNSDTSNESDTSSSDASSSSESESTGSSESGSSSDSESGSSSSESGSNKSSGSDSGSSSSSSESASSSSSESASSSSSESASSSSGRENSKSSSNESDNSKSSQDRGKGGSRRNSSSSRKGSSTSSSSSSESLTSRSGSGSTSSLTERSGGNEMDQIKREPDSDGGKSSSRESESEDSETEGREKKPGEGSATKEKKSDSGSSSSDESASAPKNSSASAVSGSSSSDDSASSSPPSSAGSSRRNSGSNSQSSSGSSSDGD
ncbi:UNVERIFIED_CONTAM: hypothetical protein HHA_207880 [Hammondia hammondi]|eukprot:XP_008886903.1 hypothetical protein HHA_207880 [Hammondia hammondi]